MTPELDWLVDIFLELDPKDDSPLNIRKLFADRIKEVNEKISLEPRGSMIPSPAYPRPGHPVTTVSGVHQAPSTLAAMARHGDIQPVVMPIIQAPEPVAVIAQTPATAAAMNSRNEAINAALSGKIDKVNGRPRKF